MMDEYEAIHEWSLSGAVLVNGWMGGSLGRTEATGYGCILLREALKNLILILKLHL